MTIVYKYNDNLYVNLTNKCSANCTFCLRQTRDKMGNSNSLWLSHEPDFDEVKSAFENEDMSKYKEVIFCGFGEPTERFDLLIKVAKFIKDNYNIPVRINTNGHGNIINDRDITQEMNGLIDSISISLNTPNKEKYNEIVRSRYGIKAFDAMLDFAKSAAKHVPNVTMTTVSTTLTKEEEQLCKQICDELNVNYRIRPYEE